MCISLRLSQSDKMHKKAKRVSEREQDHVLSEVFLVAVIGLVNASVERDESLLDDQDARKDPVCVCWIWKHAAFMYTPRALHILEGHADNMLDQAKQNSLFPAAPRHLALLLVVLTFSRHCCADLLFYWWPLGGRCSMGLKKLDCPLCCRMCFLTRKLSWLYCLRKTAQAWCICWRAIRKCSLSERRRPSQNLIKLALKLKAEIFLYIKKIKRSAIH